MIVKRLLVPLILLGLALLPSGISAALQSASPSGPDVLLDQPVPGLQGAAPTHGKPHSQKRNQDQDQDQDQDIDDDDEQTSEQTNETDGNLFINVIPVAAVAPILSQDNIPLCVPANVIRLELVIDEKEDGCQGLGSENSQAVENVANNGIYQKNEDEQELEDESDQNQDQDQDQDQLNAG